MALRYVSGMFRVALILLGLALLPPLVAQEANDGPPISITSPDAGKTFAYGSVRSRALVWNKKKRMLSAQVTFTDERPDEGQPSDDTQQFRLPGVTLDEARGVFFAATPQGEQIPVARMKQALFFHTIEIMPNAVVRIQRQHGNVTVILEAIRPGDVPLHSPAPANPDATHSVDLHQILQ